MRRPIYFDYNATTPIDRRVADVMKPFLYEHFGNPSSGHVYGRSSKQALDKAREQVASLLACDPEELLFTSGGTESNNMVLFGVCELFSEKKSRHIITSVIEHPAITAPCEALKQKGVEITQVSVDQHGMIDPKDIADAIRPDTVLISIMHANNEVGTVQPIEEISAIAKKNNIWLHSDAAQSVGKIPVTVDALGVDFLSLAGHKLYAPKGIGALYIRKGIELPNLMFGASQEFDRRPGTENLLEIVGLGKAAELLVNELDNESTRMLRLRERLWSRLSEKLKDKILRNGHPEKNLPNTLHVGFSGVKAAMLLESLQEELAVSAGSACHSDQTALSAVLQAMDLPVEFAHGCLRFSIGRYSLQEEIDRSVELICDAYRLLSS